VIRLLDREADITTRYGGGFVQSIEGLGGTERDGRSYDWFFYMNGIESPVGSAEVRVHGGDRVWWDYRDWTDAMRVPAVVGSWPEPFLQASAGADRVPVRVVCAGPKAPCGVAQDRLADAGVDASVEPDSSDAPDDSAAMRLLVGPWDEVRHDRVAAQLDAGPGTSGVFARFESPAGGGGSGEDLVALDPAGRPARELGSHAGLLAALGEGDDPPTWLATGSDGAAVRRAVGLLDEKTLGDRYAVAAVAHGAPVPLPASRGERSG